MQSVGDLYCRVKDNLQDKADLVQVDPRNLGYLVPRLWGDIWRYRPPLKDALRTLFLSFTPPAIVIDGRIVYNHELPSLDELLAGIGG